MSEPEEAVVNAPEPAAEGIPLDPPSPALPILQQREMPIFPAVDVRVTEPVQVQSQPARLGVINVENLSTTVPLQVLSPDPRRQAAKLVSTATFDIRSKRDSGSAPWPANVVLEWGNASELWVLGSASEQELTVITEVYAQ